MKLHVDINLWVNRNETSITCLLYPVFLLPISGAMQYNFMFDTYLHIFHTPSCIRLMFKCPTMQVRQVLQTLKHRKILILNKAKQCVTRDILFNFQFSKQQLLFSQKTPFLPTYLHLTKARWLSKLLAGFILHQFHIPQTTDFDIYFSLQWLGNEGWEVLKCDYVQINLPHLALLAKQKMICVPLTQ